MFTGSCPKELEDAISVKIFSVSVECMQCEYLETSVCKHYNAVVLPITNLGPNNFICKIRAMSIIETWKFVMGGVRSF